MQPETDVADDRAYHSRLLLAIRRKHQWTQRQLAVELSVSVRTIRNWEHGVTQPNARDQLLFEVLLADSAA